MHARTSAQNFRIGIFTDFLKGFRILCECPWINQTCVKQRFDIGQAFLPLRCDSRRLNFSIHHVQIIAVIIVYKCIHEEWHNAYTKLLNGATQRHFICFSIPVRILCFESFQHFFEFFGCLRHFQIQLLQPLGIEPHFARIGAVKALCVSDKPVDITIRRCVKRSQIIVLFHSRFNIRSIFIN
ncbi:hypothetical protein D3C78_1397160 [compost metagenome]